MPPNNKKYSTDEPSLKKGLLGIKLSLKLFFQSQMSIHANSTIHSTEQINLNRLKYIKYSYVIKNIRRTNLTSKRAFWL